MKQEISIMIGIGVCSLVERYECNLGAIKYDKPVNCSNVASGPGLKRDGLHGSGLLDFFVLISC